jgi:hypothetical protein
VVSAFPARYVFSFFAGMMCLQLLWVKTMVPETKMFLWKEFRRNWRLDDGSEFNLTAPITARSSWTSGRTGIRLL